MTHALRQLDLLEKVEPKPLTPASNGTMASAAPSASAPQAPDSSKQTKPPLPEILEPESAVGADAAALGNSIISWVKPPSARAAKPAPPAADAPSLPPAPSHAKPDEDLKLAPDATPDEPLVAALSDSTLRGTMSESRGSRLGTVLVVGGTGAFGGAVAEELLARGASVRLIVRDAPKAWTRFGDGANVKMIKGDACDLQMMLRAAEGCEAIINGAGQPLRRWGAELAAISANVLEAAREIGSTVLTPGHTLALGDSGGRPASEGATNRPMTQAGRARAEIEDRFRMAAAGGRSRTLLLRFGDCFGPTVRNPLVDGIFGNALMGEAMIAWGRLETAHQWAFMPDVARVAADLLVMGQSAHAFDGFEVINFGGYIVRPHVALYERVAEALGYSRPSTRRRTWFINRLRALGSVDAAEMMERRGEFDRGVLLDDTKLMRLFPQFEATPLDEAIGITLDSYRSDALRAGSEGVGGGRKIQRPL